MKADKIFGHDRILVLCNGVWQIDEIDKAGFRERDIEILEVNDGETQYVIQTPHGELSRAFLGIDEVLKARISCGTEKEFVLIGKDTGVKRRWENNLPLYELFGAIDAMPMRRLEMRTREDN